MTLGFHSKNHESNKFPSERQLNKDVMKAIVWKGSKKVACEMREKPQIVDTTDVIVKVTHSSVSSGTDSLLYSGNAPEMNDGMILGHEACGIIEEVGSKIEKLKVNDHVVISPIVACGTCKYCERGDFAGCAACNNSRLFEEMYGGPPSAAVFGCSGLYGNLTGCQAEYVRVPFGDINCYKIPDSVSREKAILIGDVLAPALHATEMAAVKKGDNVVVFGLGPVGLYAAAWCQMKGANKILGIDNVRERLDLAHRKFSINVFNRRNYTPNELLKRIRGTLPVGGVDAIIDATSTQGAGSWQHRFQRALHLEKDQNGGFQECFHLVRKFGHISIISEHLKDVNHFPIGNLYQKNVTVRSGHCSVQKYFAQVMEALEKDAIDPTWIVSHRIRFDQVPEAYEKLFYKQQGYIKVLVEMTDQPRNDDGKQMDTEDELKPRLAHP